MANQPLPDWTPRPYQSHSAHRHHHGKHRHRSDRHRSSGEPGSAVAASQNESQAKSQSTLKPQAAPKLLPLPTHASTSPNTKPKSVPSKPLKIPRSKMNPFDAVPPANPTAVAAVVNLTAKISAAYPTLAQTFNIRYTEWKNSWFSGNNKFSSNSASRATGPHFASLVALGPKITPFVVRKLTASDDFFAVELYNKIERNAAYKVDPKDLLNYNILQRHANLIVDMNYERYNNVEQAMDSWKRVMQKYCHLGSGPTGFADDEAFKSLVELGEGAIAHVMLEWKTNTDVQVSRLWGVVIEKLVKGSQDAGVLPSGSQSWKDWSEWYESKDYEITP